VTFTASLFMFVLAIIRGNSDGWGSTRVVTLFAGSAALMVVFVMSQIVQDEPMFDLALFRKPTFGGAAIVAFSLSAAMFAMFLYLTLYLQTTLNLSPLQAGLRFLPFTVLSFVVSAISGNLSTRIPVRFLLSGGLLLTSIGLLLMHAVSASSGWTALLPGFIVAGSGVGLVNPALASTAIGVVPPQRSGMASGINNTFRQVGTAAGIAVLGAIFESDISRDLAPKLAGTPAAGHAAQIGHAVAAGGSQQVLSATPAGQRHAAALAIHSSFVSALDNILIVGSVIAFAGAVLGLVLVRSSDFVTYRMPEPAGAAAG
ncbi:MAG TPA: MFS transporter, partial [Pseudonocardiaceae bacterium]|nr:MFS transporter [Pseudonocardiaceae bacterium]